MSSIPDFLEHEPESIEAARARYPEAVRRTYTIQEAIDVRPGRWRQHVFDFKDGIRLIVSKEFDPSWPGPAIHVSASASEGSRIFEDVMAMGNLLLKPFLDVAIRRCREISGHNGPIKFLGLSPKGVPHWVVPCDWLA